VALIFLFAVAAIGAGGANDKKDEIGGSREKQGLRILEERFNPPLLPLMDFKHRDREKVGLGSYLVNAVGGCNDCHTCPSYAPGHNPYDGFGDGKSNTANYLAGGTPLAPGITSANLTPNLENGRPEDEDTTFQIFRQRIRTGHDVPKEPTRILQVMPWPVYRNMTDEDLRAIFEFLRAIPHAEPGVCQFPGQ
jgi:hypothetical protein